MHERRGHEPWRGRPRSLALAALVLLVAPSALGLALPTLADPVEAFVETAATPLDDAPPTMAALGAPALPTDDPPAKVLPPTYVPARSVGWGASMADQELAMECPAADPTVVFRPDTDTIIERTGCPFRIIDGADLLGSPALAIDPNDPNRLAFFSLHGCATDEGPNPWSRVPGGCHPLASSQTHTAFLTLNEGREWVDNPHGNAGMGEAATGIIDRDGRIYIAHLFSNPLGSTPEGERLFKYQIHLYKEQDWSHLNYYSREIPTRADGNVVEHVNLALVTPWTRIENVQQYNQTMNETVAGPSGDGDVGNFTQTRAQEKTDDDLVAAIWHERAIDWEDADTGKSSWVGVAWTDTSSRNDWTMLAKEQLVGPCRHASNGVAWNGRIYVACSVDAGYDGRRGARIGDVDIWAIDPSGNDGKGSKQFVSQAIGVRDGELTMDINDEGMMGLVSTRPIGPGPTYKSVQVDIAFSWYGRHWVSLNPAGPLLHSMWNTDFREARVTAVEVLDGPRPTLYLSYLERSNETTQGEADPNNPLAVSNGALEYHKSISSWDACGQGLGALHDLQIGIVRHPFEEGVVNEFTGAFDDFQDGMAQGIDPFGLRYVYFTWGDHGVIQYGKILANSGSLVCTVPAAPPLFVPPPPVPAALAGSAGVGTGMVALMAAPAATMFAYLLVAKRRNALAAVTKAK